MNKVLLYDSRGNVLHAKSKSIDLDPLFFHLSPSQTLNTEDIVAEPYLHHAWTHACAYVIARNVSQMPLILIDKTYNEQIEDQWGILDLFESPNSIMTRTTFIQICVLSLLLSDKPGATGGQIFITPSNNEGEHNKVNLQKGVVPEYILPLSTKYFKPAVTKSKGLVKLNGWIFEIPGETNTRTPYLPEELIRIYLANPYAYLNGISNQTPAAIALYQDIKSDVYNNNLYDNNATPAGILSSEMLMTPEQRREALTSWMEEYGGAVNNNKVAVLSKGLKFQPISLTQQDMQFMEAKDWALRQIIASYGLNKIALGMYEDVNYATLREGRRMLWQDTYLPIARMLTEAINSQWIKYIAGGKIALKFDTSGIDALIPDYKDRTDAAAKMVKEMGVPASMAMRINEIPFTEEDIKNYPWLDQKPETNKTPTTSASSPATTPDDDDENENQNDDGENTTSIRKSMNEEFSISYINKVLMPGETAFEKKLIKFFHSQRNRMMDKVDEWERKQSTAKADDGGNTSFGLTGDEFLLSLPGENASMLKMFKPMIIDQLNRVEISLEEELDGLVMWHVRDETIDRFVNGRIDEINQINTTTFKKAGDKIGEALVEATKNNDTTQQAAKRFKAAIAEVGEIRKNQSMTIARTEIGIVTNQARFEAFRDEGVEYWEWVTAQDEKVRIDPYNHKGANGKITRVGEPFPVVGLRFPNDPTGAPGNIINCRCVAVFAEKPKN